MRQDAKRCGRALAGEDTRLDGGEDARADNEKRALSFDMRIEERRDGRCDAVRRIWAWNKHYVDKTSIGNCVLRNAFYQQPEHELREKSCMLTVKCNPTFAVSDINEVASASFSSLPEM